MRDNFQPIILNNVFDEETRGRLLNDCDRIWRRKDCTYDPNYGRTISNNPRLWLYMERLLPLAREVFQDDTILPSYACWAMYYEPSSRLEAHTDDNACTYTLDYCVRQFEPWDMLVEGESFTLQENQALALLGETQEHERPAFKVGNVVEMIFFHFVHPDHWYFTD